MKKIYLLVILFCTCFTRLSLGNIYYVLNNQVSGTGSLNQAILDANFHAGRDSVYFNIPFAGIADRTITINSLFLLPDISDQLVIDGTTQPVGNSFGISDAKIQITASDNVSAGLVINADSTEVYGLYINHFSVGLNVMAGNFKIGAVHYGNVINDCTDACVQVSDVIEGSILATFVGIDTSGSTGNAPLASGVYVESSKKITIGGKQVGARNFISGNNVGIKVSNSKFIDIQGNYIGIDATGSTAVPNYTGIQISNSSNNVSIGGDSVKELNVISGNLQRGLDIEMYSSTIQGNFIGLDATGTYPIGNADNGIYLRNLSHDNIIGGLTPGEGNIIAYNGKEAIYFQNTGVKNISMRGNRMFCNSQFSGDGGIVVNGGNQDLQPPIIIVVTPTSVTGISFYHLEVDIYSADSCNKCEGANYLATVLPDVTGAFTVNIPIHGKITATATDTLGNTSAFATCQDSSTTGCVISSFLIADSSICSGGTAQFTDQTLTIPGTSITSWDWDFGDGGTSTETNPSHLYDLPGTYNVVLSVANSDGCTDTSAQTIYILEAVTASFTSNTDVCLGQPVHFDDQSVPEGTSFIVSWSWMMDDGNTSFFSDFDYTYGQAGDFMPILSVTNSNGCTSEDTGLVHVRNSATADFSVTEISCSLDPVTFTDLSTVDSGTIITSWQWNFGDGDTSLDQNPIHFYTASGSYSVQLIVQDNIGCSDTASQTVEVLSAPIAGFTWTIDGLTVDFQNTSVYSSDVSIHWKFGDGSNSTLADPSHTYSVGGSYDVCLVIIDNTCDLSDTICQTILITGIEDINNYLDDLITISPNPATSGVTISNIPSLSKIKSLQLLNSIGEEIQLPTPIIITSNSLYVPLPTLPQSMYLLRIWTSDGNVMKKIMISNK